METCFIYFQVFSCKIRDLICLFISSFIFIFNNCFLGTCNLLGVMPDMGDNGEQKVKSSCPHTMYSLMGDT